MSYNGKFYNICFQVKRQDIEQHYAELNFWCVNKTFWREMQKNFVYTSWGKELGVGGERLSFTSYFFALPYCLSF